MLSLVFLLAAAALGIALVRIALRGMLNPLEQGCAGVCIGWIVASLIAYGAARVVGGISWSLMLGVTAAITTGAAVLWAPAAKTHNGSATWRAAEHLPLAILLLLFVPLYGALFQSRMFQQRGDGLYSGGTSQFDMAFHMALSTSFLHGRNFPPAYPVLPPEPLLYPPAPDFLTAALVAGGFSFHFALVATGVTLATAITILFYLMAVRFIRSAPDIGLPHIAAAIATALFLLNGGFEFLRDAAQSQVRWSNIIVDGFLPQRTSLFGIPVALLVFGIFAGEWYKRHEAAESPRWSGSYLMILAGLVTASLPFIHPHSFLAVCLVSVFLFLLRPRLVWLAFWLPAVAPAIGYIFAAGSHLAGGANIRMQPGWFVDGQSSWPIAWLENFGLPGLLIVPAWLSAPTVWRRFYLAFVTLLVVAFVFVFSPNDTDNLKLVLYWYAPTCLLIGRWLAGIATRRAGPVLAAVLVVGCVASALLSLLRELRTEARIFTRAEQNAADFAIQQTPADALFLTASTLHHPIVSLAGRATLRGPTSWVWSHGYDFRAREADVRRIYAGTRDAPDLLEFYRIDYVYLGDAERHDLSADAVFFANRFPLAYDSAGIKIYDVRPTSPRVGGRSHRPPPRELAARFKHDPAAWFTEFPRISYFVHRFYLLENGRPPRFDECLDALEMLGRSVHVGAPGWESRFEENKLRFLMERSRRGAAGTAAADLLASIDEPQLYKREYDAAYLLMHYFGYLRRNPDDPPDHSAAGYDFWLANLKRTRDYRAISRAFLESTEYKQRSLDD